MNEVNVAASGHEGSDNKPKPHIQRVEHEKHSKTHNHMYIKQKLQYSAQHRSREVIL